MVCPRSCASEVVRVSSGAPMVVSGAVGKEQSSAPWTSDKVDMKSSVLGTVSVASAIGTASIAVSSSHILIQMTGHWYHSYHIIL